MSFTNIIPNIEKHFHCLYIHFTKKEMPVLSAPNLMVKALPFATQLNGEGNSFKDSQGWLNKLKICYRISQ